jgi:hypothetical protein
MLSRIRQRASTATIMLAASGAIVIVALCTLVAVSLAGGDPSAGATTAGLIRQTPTGAAQLSTHTPTHAKRTAVPHPSATATDPPTPHPLPVPTDNPPPPPAPKPTAIPATATPRPAPTKIATTPTPCPTGGCPTATPLPPLPTPGPCQPGGPPYYVTPTATPTTDQIAQAITTAADSAHIPPALQEAIAWQESGWQINVIACDGGIGLMQLQPSTVTWLNNYYGIADDPYTLAGNADLGARYISYYYTFYIDYLQQNYPTTCGTNGCDWDTVWPGATDGATVRDIVISVYNEGASTMSKYGITNWWYVDDVILWYHTRYGGTGN